MVRPTDIRPHVSQSPSGKLSKSSEGMDKEHKKVLRVAEKEKRDKKKKRERQKNNKRIKEEEENREKKRKRAEETGEPEKKKKKKKKAPVESADEDLSDP